MKIGLLHPGAMGQSLGLALQVNGHEVLWLPEGRSPQTRTRATSFTGVESLAALAEQAAGLISICPPDQALAVSEQVRASGFRGVYLDANAVAPQTARAIAAQWPESYVDGGVVGPPAMQANTTRLFLSGPQAEPVAAWFKAGFLETQVVSEALDAASALKMCFAAFNKGQAAMLLAVCALSERIGVKDELFAEWTRSQPQLAKRAERSAAGTAPKAWRFTGEMREIAATFQAAELPDGFHQAAEQVYAAMAPLKGSESVDLDAVLSALLRG